MTMDIKKPPKSIPEKAVIITLTTIIAALVLLNFWIIPNWSKTLRSKSAPAQAIVDPHLDTTKYDGLRKSDKFPAFRESLETPILDAVYDEGKGLSIAVSHNGRAFVVRPKLVIITASDTPWGEYLDAVNAAPDQTKRILEQIDKTRKSYNNYGFVGFGSPNNSEDCTSHPLTKISKVFEAVCLRALELGKNQDKNNFSKPSSLKEFTDKWKIIDKPAVKTLEKAGRVFEQPFVSLTLFTDNL